MATVTVNTVSGGDYSSLGAALSGESGLTEDLIITVSGNSANPDSTSTVGTALASFVYNGYSVTVQPASGQEISSLSRNVNTNIYQLAGSDFNGLSIRGDISFYGIQFVFSTTGTGTYSFITDFSAAQACTGNFYNCIIINSGGSAYAEARGVYTNTSAYTVQLNFYNCLLTGWGGGGSTGYAVRKGNGTAPVLENSLIVTNGTGLRDATGTNCIVFDNDDDFLNGTYTYCASDDTQTGTGNVAVADWSLAFTDWSNNDFGYIDPSPSTNPLIDAGTTGTYAYDFSGNSRTGTWDIGPNEGYAASGSSALPLLNAYYYG